ncbi:MAG: flavodoxin domain-containing protein [Ornithinimicrobium sp.]|uniref:flavodoxin domain-containing protein n=1 Tax=Ornithinimicrobium sp. TaxID=1977084 RepID=UPI003D9B3D68
MHVLVTAGSKHGATAEIAAAIGAALGDRGIQATVADPSDVTDLEGYDAVVLGSAVYAGHWLEPARDLVDRLHDALATRLVWLFSSGPVGDPAKPDEGPVEVAGIAQITRARSHRVFAGKLDRSKLGFGEKAIVMALRAPEGDFRDWQAISTWAAEIAEALTGHTASAS